MTDANTPEEMPIPSLDVLKKILARLQSNKDAAAPLIAWAVEQIEEQEASFDLRWKADMRAIKRWQEAHPGNDLRWPDHADMVVWLLGQLDISRTSQPPNDVVYWLIELVPAFDGHPPFPATYYAGYMKSPVDAAMTQDVHASPKFTRKEDAQAVAAQLVGAHTLSCVWTAVEHGFHSLAPEPRAHKWDGDGEHCTVCGQSDWMGGDCTPKQCECVGPCAASMAIGGRQCKRSKDSEQASLAALFKHWSEFGPEHGFGELIETLCSRLPAETGEGKPDPAPEGCEDWWHLKKHGYAPGNYSILCIDCKQEAMWCDKRAATCKPCAEKRHATETGGSQS